MSNLITDIIKENIGFDDFVLQSCQIFLGKKDNYKKTINVYKELIEEYKNKNIKYHAKINKIMCMNESECESSALADVLRADIEFKKRNELKKEYEKTLKEVENWVVDEEYYELKKFIIKRIKTSINFDCFEFNCSEYVNGNLNGKEWQKLKIKKLTCKIKYNENAIIDESKKCKRYREWVNKLISSLEN